MAGAALLELAAKGDAEERGALEAVADWLARVATPSRHAGGGARCECGSALAHVAGAGVEAVLCPRCDAEQLAEACGDDDEPRGAQAAARAGLTVLGVLLGFSAALSACAQAHGRIEDGPLYVHLCDAMPEDDQLAWGEAAGEINAELGEPLLWVGHGPPIGCNTVDVCPSSAVHEGAETTAGECVIRVRYAPGAARDVAPRTLDTILRTTQAHDRDRG